MHKGHLTGCVIAIGAALVLFTVTGGSIGGLGVLLAVAICPLTMGAVMWFLMGTPRRGASAGEVDAADRAPVDTPAPR